MARYIIIAGFAWLWVWKLKAHKFSRWIIQGKLPETKHLKRDFFYSLSTMFIFATIGAIIIMSMKAGLTRIYPSISDYGVPYFIFSIVLFLLVHDTFFYWAHRFMHLPGVYQRVHLVHHLSTNPSPWTAFAFHPLESFLEALILPLMMFFVPLNFYAIVIFLIVMTVMNVIGHLGYELYPAGFLSHPLGRWNNTSTFHNMHHRLSQCNYGLYFNWWDSWMKTNHPEYIKSFDKIKTG